MTKNQNADEPKPPPQQLQLSAPAAEDFAKLKDEFRNDERWSHSCSSSVMIEFLYWWWVRTTECGEPLPEGFPDVYDFRPETAPQGRPRSAYGTGTLRPVDIRKLAGIDPITKERKLR